MNEGEIRQKLAVLETYNQQIQKLQEELVNIELMKNEINKAIETLEGIKENDEVLFPIGAGAFVRAKILEKDKVIVGIGANIFADKDIDEVIKEFKKSVEDIEKAESKGKEQIENTVKVARKIQKELEKEFARIQKEQQDQE
ncbi:prefoldin subunit alpha [Methanotorris formicicus]|uniref:Prefoldin subunit alpha n=1 Tax=Methanotorris formicicus Mc-S-70 TaxID=647171 RepID=H1KZD9_9EURY|nr:prefoldin subunit alpha [Methanotorris formicicus]EHP86059.1 prefoldin, alpha subunit [Methanotorris formicicus Mc-S-70]